MAIYYCSACAKKRDLKDGVDPSNLLGSTYQQDKFRKHTHPTTGHPVQSVFDSNSTQYYSDCVNETIEEGFVEIDDQQRKNILLCPSTQSSLGSKLRWGEQASRPDTIVVVNTSESSAMHSFLEDSSKYAGKHCADCGKPVL